MNDVAIEGEDEGEVFLSHSSLDISVKVCVAANCVCLSKLLDSFGHVAARYFKAVESKYTQKRSGATLINPKGPHMEETEYRRCRDYEVFHCTEMCWLDARSRMSHSNAPRNKNDLQVRVVLIDFFEDECDQRRFAF